MPAFHWQATRPNIDGNRITGGKALLESLIEPVLCRLNGRRRILRMS
jgi:hypothetical protein